jgi:Fibrobacter succinogenes major domain (Fib_succ_major).
MKNKILKLAISLGVAAVISGCNSEIDMVKNGTLYGHQETTVGKAIESVFGEVEWNYFETDKGVRVVEAKGYPGKQMFIGNKSYARYDEKKLIEKYCLSPKKFVMQFMLHMNSNDFELSYCGSEEGNSVKCDGIIDYIYHGSTKYEPMTEMCKDVLAQKAEKEAEKARVEEEKRKAEEMEKVAEENRKKRMVEAKESIQVFKDSRNQKEYYSVEIGGLRWMAANLNYEEEKDSYCYKNLPENCEVYGRLYTWNAAMKVCPEGWRLPSKDDFDGLILSVGERYAGNRLRTKVGWADEKNGSDDFFFAARPAGIVEADRGWWGKGEYAIFWTATENDEKKAYALALSYGGYANRGYASTEIPYSKDAAALSVRCVKDLEVESDLD